MSRSSSSSSFSSQASAAFAVGVGLGSWVAAAAYFAYLARVERLPPIRSRASTSTSTEKKLVQAHVVFRHGARTPVFGTPGLLDDAQRARFTGMCLGQHARSVRVAQLTLDVLPSSPSSDANVSRARSTHLHVQPETAVVTYGECAAGQMTDLGARQSVQLGRELVARYGALWNGETTTRWLRTSQTPRCVETLAHVLHEFNALPARAWTALPHTETLYPHANCALIARLFALSRTEWVHEASRDPEVDAIVARVPVETREKLRLHDLRSVVRLRDVITSYEAHGLPRPWLDGDEDDEDLVRAVDRLGTRQVAHFLRHGGRTYDEVAARAGIGRFLRDVVAFVHEPGERVSLVSAHDTTLMALMSALGVWDGETWPGFCAWLALEVWEEEEEENTKRRRTLRVVYNGETRREGLTLTGDVFAGVVPATDDDDDDDGSGEDPCVVVVSAAVSHVHGDDDDHDGEFF